MIEKNSPLYAVLKSNWHIAKALTTIAYQNNPKYSFHHLANAMKIIEEHIGPQPGSFNKPNPYETPSQQSINPRDPRDIPYKSTVPQQQHDEWKKLAKGNGDDF
jgi:hypothetical protein